MEVGAIGAGGMSMGAAPQAAGNLAPAGNSGVTGETGSAGVETGGISNDAMNPFVSVRFEQLADLMKDFSSAEILMLLMLLSACKDDEDKESSGAALGFLMGLSMANQMGQNFSLEFEGENGSFSIESSSGINLNLTA